MRLALDHPLALGLLLGCLPALLGYGTRWIGFASTAMVPSDAPSRVLDVALRSLAALPIACIAVGLAGLHERQDTVQRTGTGAHVIVALDRSLSMDEPFALRGERGRESKTAAAARLLAAFYARRPHDSFGLVAFSTSPIPVMPLTQHRDAVNAAIAAMRQKALANTDIGSAVAVGLAQFAADPPGAARVLLLISDGAGTIPEQTRDYIRAALGRSQAHLYYLYLRSSDDPPLAEATADADDMSRPEGLDAFFRQLGAPYQGFEARDGGAIDAAIRRIEALETHPVTYTETLPRRDLDIACYTAAAIFLLLSLLAQLAERRLESVPASARQ
jgi:mxaC protein